MTNETKEPTAKPSLFPAEAVPVPDHIKDPTIRQAAHQQAKLRERHREVWEQLHETRQRLMQPVWSQTNANEHDVAALELRLRQLAQLCGLARDELLAAIEKHGDGELRAIARGDRPARIWRQNPNYGVVTEN